MQTHIHKCWEKEHTVNSMEIWVSKLPSSFRYHWDIFVMPYVTTHQRIPVCFNYCVYVFTHRQTHKILRVLWLWGISRIFNRKNPSDVIFLKQDGLIFLAFKPCKILTPDTHVRKWRTQRSLQLAETPCMRKRQTYNLITEENCYFLSH